MGLKPQTQGGMKGDTRKPRRVEGCLAGGGVYLFVCFTNKTSYGRGQLLVKGLKVLCSEEVLFCKGNFFHLM